MVSIFELILKDPLKGLLAFALIFCLYLWREQGKIKSEISSVERFLDKKKLDKEDFELYNGSHSKEHDGLLAHMKTAIELLKGRKIDE